MPPSANAFPPPRVPPAGTLFRFTPLEHAVVEDLSGRFDALIFDCDGTLVDSMPAHYDAWVRSLARYGMTLSEDRFYRLGGVPAHKIVATLADEHGVQLDAGDFAHQKERLFVECSGGVQPITPVIEIARFHHGKLPLAVATGSHREPAHKSLQRVGIDDIFDAVVCAEDVERHKPAPDVYLEAARRLGVDPKRCRAFEDTEVGMTAARDAGMDVVNVWTLIGAPQRG